LDSLSTAPGAGKFLGCQAERSHLNLPWELREVSASMKIISMDSNVSRVKLQPLKELLEDSLEEQRSLPSTRRPSRVTKLGSKPSWNQNESDMSSSKAPGDA
jgi:hypothetical protein